MDQSSEDEGARLGRLLNDIGVAEERLEALEAASAVESIAAPSAVESLEAPPAVDEAIAAPSVGEFSDVEGVDEVPDAVGPDMSYPWVEYKDKRGVIFWHNKDTGRRMEDDPRWPTRFHTDAGPITGEVVTSFVDSPEPEVASYFGQMTPMEKLKSSRSPEPEPGPELEPEEEQIRIAINASKDSEKKFQEFITLVRESDDRDSDDWVTLEYPYPYSYKTPAPAGNPAPAVIPAPVISMATADLLDAVRALTLENPEISATKLKKLLKDKHPSLKPKNKELLVAMAEVKAAASPMVSPPPSPVKDSSTESNKSPSKKLTTIYGKIVDLNICNPADKRKTILTPKKFIVLIVDTSGNNDKQEVKNYCNIQHDPSAAQIVTHIRVDPKGLDLLKKDALERIPNEYYIWWQHWGQQLKFPTKELQDELQASLKKFIVQNDNSGIIPFTMSFCAKLKLKEYAHISQDPNSYSQDFNAVDNALIAGAERRGDENVRLPPLQLSNGKILWFEVCFRANEKSKLKDVQTNMYLVNLETKETRVVFHIEETDSLTLKITQRELKEDTTDGFKAFVLPDDKGQHTEEVTINIWNSVKGKKISVPTLVAEKLIKLNIINANGTYKANNKVIVLLPYGGGSLDSIGKANVASGHSRNVRLSDLFVDDEEGITELTNQLKKKLKENASKLQEKIQRKMQERKERKQQAEIDNSDNPLFAGMDSDAGRGASRSSSPPPVAYIGKKKTQKQPKASAAEASASASASAKEEEGEGEEEEFITVKDVVTNSTITPDCVASFHEEFSEIIRLLKQQRGDRHLKAYTEGDELYYMRECQQIFLEVHSVNYNISPCRNPPDDHHNSVYNKYFNRGVNIENLEEAIKEIKGCLVLRRKMQVIVDLWLDINLYPQDAMRYKTTNEDYITHLFQLEAMAFLHQLFTTGDASSQSTKQRDMLVHYQTQAGFLPAVGNL